MHKANRSVMNPGKYIHKARAQRAADQRKSQVLIAESFSFLIIGVIFEAMDSTGFSAVSMAFSAYLSIRLAISSFQDHLSRFKLLSFLSIAIILATSSVIYALNPMGVMTIFLIGALVVSVSSYASIYIGPGATLLLNLLAGLVSVLWIQIGGLEGNDLHSMALFTTALSIAVPLAFMNSCYSGVNPSFKLCRLINA